MSAARRVGSMGSEKPQKVTTFLVVRDGVKPDWVAIWDTVEITVGRHETQDIPVRESEVSRKHCVFRQKTGVYTIEDLGSALGTSVNGAAVKVHELEVGRRGRGRLVQDQIRADRESDQAGRERPLCLAAQGIHRARRQGERRGRPHDDGDRPERLDVRHAGDAAQVVAEGARRVARRTPRRRRRSRPERRSRARRSRAGARSRRFARRLRRWARAARAAARRAGAAFACAGVAPATVPRPAPTGDVRLQVVLEIAGPAEQVEALVSAVGDKPIQVYPLTLCVRDPRKR